MDAKTRIYGVQCSQVATRRASGPKQGAFPPRVTRLSEKWNPWQVRLAVAAERIPFDTRPLCSSRGIFFALGAAVGARDYCGRPRTGGRHYPPRPRPSKGDCVTHPPNATALASPIELTGIVPRHRPSRVLHLSQPPQFKCREGSASGRPYHFLINGLSLNSPDSATRKLCVSARTYLVSADRKLESPSPRRYEAPVKRRRSESCGCGTPVRRDRLTVSRGRSKMGP